MSALATAGLLLLGRAELTQAQADAVRHYEKGGIDRPSRSPMSLLIQLSEPERLDLVAFMETLSGDGEGAQPNR